MAMSVANDFAHVSVVVIGQIGGLGFQLRYDPPAAGVTTRCSRPLCPTVLDSLVASHFYSSAAVMLTVSLNSFQVVASSTAMALLRSPHASGLWTASRPLLSLRTDIAGLPLRHGRCGLRLGYQK